MAEGTATRRGRGDSSAKRDAIVRGALRVFARDGYTRASIDAIAAEAGVSTRTIYNHFHDKAGLFGTAIQESATQVADAQIAIIERYLDRITDVEQNLIEFACAWAAPAAEHVDHFAMIRQINAEFGHIPQEAWDAWQEKGPVRVRRALARRLESMAQHGLLQIENTDRAARHLVLLSAAEVTSRSHHGLVDVPNEEIVEIATSGVRAFLYGYRA